MTTTPTKSPETLVIELSAMRKELEAIHGLKKWLYQQANSLHSDCEKKEEAIRGKVRELLDLTHQ